MKILLVHRYFWPDTPPYAQILRSIAQRWSEDGHQVEILSAQPSYKVLLGIRRLPRVEDAEGVRVHRLSLPNEANRPFVRALNAVRLCFAVLYIAIRGRFDVIMISTVPPVVGGFVAALSAKLTRARFIYHCMDIQPEVGRISGEFANDVVFKVLVGLDNWTCKQANPVIVLSSDMERTLRQRRGGAALRIIVLNNFSLPSEQFGDQVSPIDCSPNKLTVLFAGNIGRFQGLETAIEAMASIRDRADIEMILMGEGISKKKLQELAESRKARVRFIGHQSIEMAKEVMRRTDLGFVSLVPGLYRYAYPSKTMTYLEQGCPLIIAVESDSELARSADTEKFGFCVPVNDHHALASLLTRLADDKSWSERMRIAAYSKWKSEFSESVVLNKWSRVLQDVGSMLT